MNHRPECIDIWNGTSFLGIGRTNTKLHSCFDKAWSHGRFNLTDCMHWLWGRIQPDQRSS